MKAVLTKRLLIKKTTWGSFAMVCALIPLSCAAQIPVHADTCTDPLAERLSISETGAGALFPGQSDDLIEKRLADYKMLGVGNVRLAFGWRDLAETNSANLRFMQLVHKNGLKLRLTLGALKPPLAKRKSMEKAGLFMKNRDGEYSPTLSVWHPKVPKIIDEMTPQLFQRLADAGLLEAISGIIIDLGPAGEPIYPAVWMMNAENKAGAEKKPSDTTFWFYDRFAHDDFVAQMKIQYDTITQANEVWGTDYADWSSVRIPEDGTPSGMWRDVLTWYRDSKRRFIRRQVDLYKNLVRKFYSGDYKPELLILVTGKPLSEKDWEQAMERGEGTSSIKTIIDHEFLIDLAHEKGLALQHAAIHDKTILSGTQAYMREKGYHLRIWGENNNVSRDEISHNSGWYADLALGYGFFGLEFLAARDLYEPSGEKTALYPAFAEAIEEFRKRVPVKVSE